MNRTGKAKIDITTSQFEPPKSNQSQLIASSIITEMLIAKAVNLCIPKSMIFQNCKKDAHKVSDSVVTLSQTKPDCSPKRIRSIKDLNPTFFKIKKKAERGSSLRIAPEEYSMKSLTKINGLSTSSLNVQFPLFNSNRKSQRVFPSLSVHQPEKYKKEMFRQIRHFENETEEEAIRVLRENKISMKTQYVPSSEKNSPVQRSQFRKKIKENQSKKQLGITTDYHGNMVHLGKKQLKRKVSHYINMQAEIYEDKNKIQKDSLHIYQPQKSKVLQQQFTNYKFLVLSQVDDQFTNYLTKNLNQQQEPSQNSQNKNDFQKENNENSSLQENTGNSQQEFVENEIKKKCLDFKITGKTFKPTSVGFNIFYKMKTLNWKIQQPKQQKHHQYSQQEKQNLIKQPIHTIPSHSPKNNNSKTKQNKKDVITTVGSVNAMNILFRDDRKYMKKVVTIDSQFL